MVDELVGLYAQTKDAPRRTLLGLAGIPGSGKTTLASALADGVNRRVGREVCAVVGMDGFHLTRKQLDKMPDPAEAHRRRGAEWTFNPEGFAELLRNLVDRPTQTVTVPTFDHAVKDPVEGRRAILPQHRLVIVEGIYVLLQHKLWGKCSSILARRWFIDIDPKKSKARVVPRHVAAGICKTEKEAGERWDSNDGINSKLIVENVDWARLDAVVEAQDISQLKWQQLVKRTIGSSTSKL